MPGYERAGISAELTVTPSEAAGKTPEDQVEAAKAAAGESGLAREAGPAALVLAGGRSEVLAAATKVIEAAMDAGAREVRVKVEVEGDARRFQ